MPQKGDAAGPDSDDGIDEGQQTQVNTNDTADQGSASTAQNTNGNLISNLKEGALEDRFVRVINAAELKRKAKCGVGSGLTYLPFLGQDGYIVKGWSHLVVSLPKVGKTELMARLVMSWPDESVLYLTEESRPVWENRVQKLDPLDHVWIDFALGRPLHEIIAQITSRDESVVIVDTIRSLLGMQDENDNSEVARVLIPVIAAARQAGKTLILLHHQRKGGGDHGEGITGGHAFFGFVDIALVIHLQGASSHTRRVEG